MPPRRKQKSEWDAGRLQLERERFHLPADYKPPPPIKSQSLGDVLPEVMGELGLKSDWNVADLEPRWNDLVGPANAQHCRPGRWERGVLTVYVDHHVWLAELQRFGKASILKRIRRDMSEAAIRDVRFELDPEMS